MGDDTTVHGKEPATISATPASLGDISMDSTNIRKAPSAEFESSNGGKLSIFSQTKNRKDIYETDQAGTELLKKKSHYPEVFSRRPHGVTSAGKKQTEKHYPEERTYEIELLHLNRTCTTADLVETYNAQLPDFRSSSDANLSEQEKVHRVRHQVSFAVPQEAEDKHKVECNTLLKALRNSAFQYTALDPKMEEEPSRNQSLERVASEANDMDYLKVRPSLASTHLIDYSIRDIERP